MHAVRLPRVVVAGGGGADCGSGRDGEAGTVRAQASGGEQLWVAVACASASGRCRQVPGESSGDTRDPPLPQWAHLMCFPGGPSSVSLRRGAWMTQSPWLVLFELSFFFFHGQVGAVDIHPSMCLSSTPALVRVCGENRWGPRCLSVAGEGLCRPTSVPRLRLTVGPRGGWRISVTAVWWPRGRPRPACAGSQCFPDGWSLFWEAAYCLT